HSGRDRGDEHGGRIRGATARDVQPGAVDGHHQLAQEHTVALDTYTVAHLGLVVRGDLVACVVEGGAERGRRAVEGGAQLVGRDTKIVDPAAVEALGQLAERVVAAGAHRSDDLADGLQSR